MRGTVAAAALAVLEMAACVSTAEAQRPSTVEMTCPQARGLVSRAGGIVLGTGGATYDRFVRDRGSCEVTEITTRAFVPTRDTPNCFVGYRCKEPGRGDRFGNGF